MLSKLLYFVPKFFGLPNQALFFAAINPMFLHEQQNQKYENIWGQIVPP